MSSVDIKISPNEWLSLYSATGISSGASVLVQNKGGDHVIFYTGSVAPSNSSFSGFVIPNDYEQWEVTGEPDCWVRTDTHFSTLVVEAKV